MRSVAKPHPLSAQAPVPFPAPPRAHFTFIDLFAGIGGFRLALQQVNGRCVFSSEWDPDARRAYQLNFGELPHGDITRPEVKAQIPHTFDALCAGFPCQPFSKGGFRNGFHDTRGTLFFDICQVVERHRPKFILLENVANLATHHQGNTYRVITACLQGLGYLFPGKPLILSPDRLGIPILRPRIYIPCVRQDLAAGQAHRITHIQQELEQLYTRSVPAIDTLLDPALAPDITPYQERLLAMWDEFYQGVDIRVIGFPVWMEYFQFQGDLSGFPRWKANFIAKNMALYQRNREFIDGWLARHDHLRWCAPTHRKFEWQAGDDHSSVFQCLVQLRPSGVRVKRPDRFSTLVAMNHRQIIGPLRRWITIEEAKRLQSFPPGYLLEGPPHVILKLLGNSVNVEVVKAIFSIILKHFA